MASMNELKSYIRFQLSQLRVLNKHHVFEDLARQFARLRICENLLPATGPVGSGGDQGRDFETYRSYLASTPIATSTFLGMAGNTKIVFACSLQTSIRSKIKEDVKTICCGSEKVDAIYYFCEADLAVAQRHKLQQWCRDSFDTALEVLDGQAIAEQLTHIEVFWIAEEYLDVSAEMYPRMQSVVALTAGHLPSQGHVMPAISQWRLYLRTRKEMPELLNEMREGLTSDAYVREFFVLSSRQVSLTGSTQTRWIYYAEDHPNLLDKIHILEQRGFVHDVTTAGSAPIFRMTDDFARCLLQADPEGE
jgi:hypothetical protein